jgi:anti-sigma factor RsiW
MNMINEDAERQRIESLLPWYAAGTLSRSDADRVEQALAGDSELARCYALVLEELAETIYLNETLGEPSGRRGEVVRRDRCRGGTCAASKASSPAPNTAISAGVANLTRARLHLVLTQGPGVRYRGAKPTHGRTIRARRPGLSAGPQS